MNHFNTPGLRRKQAPVKQISLTLMLLVLMTNLSFARVIKPNDAQDRQDILVVSGKRSSYYTLKDRSLVYAVKGPERLKIYSRAVMFKKTGGTQSYGFEFQINGTQPLQVNHKQSRSKGVKSPQHPNHYFTKPAKDYINIPAGVNELIIRPQKHTDPILLRVLKDRQTPRGRKRRVDALSEEAPVILILNSRRLSYYALREAQPLFVNLEGPANLEITSRLAFDPQMGLEEDYRLQILDNGKLVGTYYFTTNRSDQTTVESQQSVVPGKWRSCTVQLADQGLHEVKLRLLDEDRQVFIKLKQILGK